MSLLTVIKYDGENDILVYKHPQENMNSYSKLVVNEFQQAVFIKGGKILDILDSGTYTLNTNKLPLLGALVNLPFGCKTPFTAEVLFVNRLDINNMKWGTPAPIQLKDPLYGILVPVRSYCQYGVRITDTRQFLSKITGNTKSFSAQQLNEYFRGVLSAKITEMIASYAVEHKVSVLEMNARLQELSTRLADGLAPVFLEHGLTLTQFHVMSVNLPEQDPSVLELKKALSKKAEMDVVGYSYDQERTLNALEYAAQNPGSGNYSNIGVGLPLGIKAGELLREQLAGAKAAGLPCKECGGRVQPQMKFCPSCGAPVV